MIRWLLIVLLFALPAQFVSAAVASYCGHEPAPSSFHIGHHTHHHGGDAGDPQVDPMQTTQDQPNGFGHSDCGSCNANVAQFGTQESNAIVEVRQRCFASLRLQFFASTIDQDIDRPKWIRAG